MQDQVAAARVAATEAYSSVKEHTADVRQTWLGWEKQGESACPARSIRSQKAPRAQLTISPGSRRPQVGHLGPGPAQPERSLVRIPARPLPLSRVGMLELLSGTATDPFVALFSVGIATLAGSIVGRNRECRQNPQSRIPEQAGKLRATDARTTACSVSGTHRCFKHTFSHETDQQQTPSVLSSTSGS